MKIHQYYVYIITNQQHNVLYVGVTNDLTNRILQHKEKTNEGFTSKYNCNKLVHFEEYQWIDDAIAREKQIKGGSRKKKVDLVTKDNPGWKDLSNGWYD